MCRKTYLVMFIFYMISASSTVRVEVTGSITDRPYFETRMTTINLDSGVALNSTVLTLVATDPTGRYISGYSPHW